MTFSTAMKSSRSLGDFMNLTLAGSAPVGVDLQEMKDTITSYLKTSEAYPWSDSGGEEVVIALANEIPSSFKPTTSNPGTTHTSYSGAQMTEYRPRYRQTTSVDSVKYQVWYVCCDRVGNLSYYELIAKKKFKIDSILSLYNYQ